MISVGGKIEVRFCSLFPVHVGSFWQLEKSIHRYLSLETTSILQTCRIIQHRKKPKILVSRTGSAMTVLLQISIKFSALNTPQNNSKNLSFWGLKSLQPITCCSCIRAKSEFLFNTRFKKVVSGERLSFLGGSRYKDGILLRDDRWKRSKRVVLIRFKEGFGFDGLGGGGGGRDNGTTARVLGNLALAIGLTYLSMTGQLGWVLDAIVSVWLLAVLLPIVGLGAFIWWAGRDIVQSSCPNCGNEFQIFKSTVNEDLQLCPFCSQPFSVVGNKFVRDPVKFSNQSTTFGDAFSEFSPRQKKGKDSSVAVVVDVEAEVKDAD